MNHPILAWNIFKIIYYIIYIKAIFFDVLSNIIQGFIFIKFYKVAL